MVTQKLSERLNLFETLPQASKSNTSKDSFESADFGSYLKHSLKSEIPVNSVKTDEKKINYNATYTREQKVPMDKQSVKADRTQANKTDTADKRPVKAKNKQSMDTKAVQKNESKSVPDNIAKKIEELSGKIKDAVKDALGITQKELEGLMEFLGMQMTDLLNINNLKLLALAANGETDFTALLTNENLSTDLNNLIQGMEQINLEDMGLTNEDLTNFLNTQQEILDSSLLDETQVLHNEKDEVSQTENESGMIKAGTENVAVANVEEMNIDNKGENQINLQNSDESNITFKVEEITEHAETSTGNENKGNANQAPVSQNTGLEQVIGNIAISAGKGTENFIEQLSAARQMRNIVNQIVDEIKVSVKPTTTSMELQLNPASLGKVNLAVMSKDGVLTAQFTVQNAAAKEAIESQLQNLKDNLSNQGLKVEAVEVTVSDFSFDGSNQADGNAKEQKQSHRKLNLEDMDALDDSETETDTNRMQMNGSTVEYTA